MTVHKIDLITEAADGTIVLVMVDERPWEGEHSRLQELQERLNVYLAFALDGFLVRQVPVARGRPVAIRLDVSSEPDPATADYFSRLSARLAELGVGFEVNVLPKASDDW